MKKFADVWKEALFNTLLHSAPQLVVCLSTEGQIELINHQVQKLYGAHEDDLLDQRIDTLDPDTPLRAHLIQAIELSKNNCLNQLTTSHRHEDQTITINWLITPNFTPDSVSLGTILLGTNVSELYETQKKLTNTQLTLDQIVNHLPHFIFWKDTESRYLGCNNLFIESTDYQSPDQIIGKNDFDMPWTREESEAYREDDLRVMKTGEPKFNYEETQHQAGGKEQIMRVSKLPLYDLNNDVMGTLCIYTNITEHRQMERNLARANMSAELANQLKTDFIKNLQHDIRTPFNGVFALANILASQEQDPQKKEHLEDIASCAEELLQYCQEILDFSQIESGSLPILNKAFEPKTLIEKIVRFETPPAKAKSISLNVFYDERLPTVLIGDLYRIERILLNLISNAIKFTLKGHIDISLTLEKMIEVERQIILRIKIKDTGLGIPQDKQDYIYEQFSRISPSNKGLFKGRGLGLRIVKSFVNELQGDIALQSEIGKGTTFTIDLPVRIPLSETLLGAS